MLGVKSIEEFNQTLLFKWKWRFLKENDSFGVSVLKDWYGDSDHNILLGDRIDKRKAPSTWSKDLAQIDVYADEIGFKFVGTLSYSIGGGGSALFGSLFGAKINISKSFIHTYLKLAPRRLILLLTWGAGLHRCGLGKILGLQDLWQYISKSDCMTFYQI